MLNLLFTEGLRSTSSYTYRESGHKQVYTIMELNPIKLFLTGIKSKSKYKPVLLEEIPKKITILVLIFYLDREKAHISLMS